MNELTVGDRSQKTPENYAQNLNDLVRKAHKAYIEANKTGAAFSASMAQFEYEQELRRLIQTRADVFVGMYRKGTGFSGDRSNYTDEQILDVVAQAGCHGIAPGNERINIISGKLYIAQNGYWSLLGTVGVENIKLVLSPAESTAAEYVVDCRASWLFQSKPDEIERRFWVKRHKGTEWDQVEGKAKRKFYKWLYEYVTTISTPDDDPDIREGAIDVSGEVVDGAPSNCDLDEQIGAILGNMLADGVAPKEFVANLVVNAPALKDANPVPLTLDEVGKADPESIRYLANNWGPALKRYREQTEGEAK